MKKLAKIFMVVLANQIEIFEKAKEMKNKSINMHKPTYT